MTPIRRFAAAAVLAALFAAPAAAQITIAPTFAGDYSFINLDSPLGVPTNLGGLTLKAGDPNTLLIGGSANNGAGAIYQIAVVRDGSNHITAFSGSATLFATAPNIDGGLAYGPDGVLFATTYSDNKLLQYKPGSTAPDKTIDLSAAGVSSSTGTLQFVPTGFTGAGQIRIASYSTSEYYSATLTPDGNGTFDLSGVTLQADFGSTGPEGLVWVPTGSPVFGTTPTVLVAEYSANRVSAYDLDANGHPVVASRQDFITGLSGAEGAFIDPLTGDFLFSTFGSGNDVIVVKGFAPVPEPAGLLAAAGLVGAAVRVVRRRR